MKSSLGFSLIELVVVIVIVGILAVFAAPRFFGTDVYDEAGFYEQSRAAIRLAQKISISSGCDVRVRFTAGTPGSYVVQRWSSCIPADHTDPTVAIQSLADSAYSATSPDSVSVSALDFYFDQIGRPRQISATNPPPLLANLTDLDLTIGSRTIQIHPLTGYVQ